MRLQYFVAPAHAERRRLVDEKFGPARDQVYERRLEDGDDHKFQDFSGRTKFIFSSEPQPKCSVQYVKFEDDTTWSAGEE